MSVVEFYDNNAGRYDAWYEKNRWAYESELIAIKELIPRDARGLEVGVGTGRFAASLGIGFGVEPSRSMGEFATDRGVVVVQGVAEALPFGDCRFDFALMVTTLCFLEDPFASIAECRRVLREGGYLIIGFVDRDSYLGRLYSGRGNEEGFYIEPKFFTPMEVESSMREAGFGDFTFIQTIFSDPADMVDVEPFKNGYGEGSFIVVRGRR